MSRSRLYRRSDSPYYQAEYTDPWGAILRRSTDCRDLAAAKEWLALKEAERVRAQAGIPIAREVSLELALARYIAAKEIDWSPGWRVTVLGMFKTQAIPHFGPATLTRDITRPMAEDFRRAQFNRDAGRKGQAPGLRVSPATVNRCMAALAAFGEWCSHPERCYMITNPFAKHAPFPEETQPPPVVDETELATVLNNLPEDFRHIFAFAVDTGLRKSELERLRWEDVDLPKRMIWVVSSYKRGRNKARKTRAQALSAAAVSVLEKLEKTKREDGLVFGPVGDRRRAFKTAARKAGLEHLWLHAARHFGASRMSQAGATPHELQTWGGWSASRMVDRYTHADIRRLQTLADRLGKGSK